MFFNRVDQLWNADRLRDEWTSLQSLLFGSAPAIASVGFRYGRLPAVAASLCRGVDPLSRAARRHSAVATTSAK